MKEEAEHHPDKDHQPSCDADLTFEGHRLLATSHGKSGLYTSERPAFDVDDVREARLQELVTGLLSTTSGATDDVERIDL